MQLSYSYQCTCTRSHKQKNRVTSIYCTTSAIFFLLLTLRDQPRFVLVWLWCICLGTHFTDWSTEIHQRWRCIWECTAPNVSATSLSSRVRGWRRSATRLLLSWSHTDVLEAPYFRTKDMTMHILTMDGESVSFLTLTWNTNHGGCIEQFLYYRVMHVFVLLVLVLL